MKRCIGPVTASAALEVLLPVLLSVLAGCGGPGRPGAVNIVYNCPANTTEISSLEKEIPAFLDSTGIFISLVPFTGQEKLYAMMAAGMAPDIFYTNSTMKDRLAAEGRLLDLRTVSAGDPFVDRLYPHVVSQGCAADGGWYSLGNWSFTCGVYFNRDMFEAAGLAPPGGDWTWEEMAGLAQQLTLDETGDGVPDRYGVFIGSHFVEALEMMNGVVHTGEEVLLDIPPSAVDTYRRYRRLMADGIMPDLRRVQALGMQAPQLLQSGRVAMLVEAVPHQTLFETVTVRWGVVPLPGSPGEPRRYFRSGSGGLSISAATEHPAEAWRALTWLVGSATLYRPNPVLKDEDFVGGWERRYPRLVGSGFREVWNLSLKYGGGDPRFFVRFSSWTSGPILERLQPMLDRLWAGDIGVDELVRAVPGINQEVRKELKRELDRGTIPAAFRQPLEKALREGG
jgi:ABC-type glycerol-3-phosphate transport system substrate-binding protein